MSWLPSSWISKRPALKESSAKALWWPSRTSPQGESGVAFAPPPPRRAGSCSASRVPRSRLARTVSGAAAFSTRDQARASSSPSSATSRSASQGGSEPSTASRSTGSVMAAMRASAPASGASAPRARPSRRSAVDPATAARTSQAAA